MWSDSNRIGESLEGTHQLAIRLALNHCNDGQKFRIACEFRVTRRTNNGLPSVRKTAMFDQSGIAYSAAVRNDFCREPGPNEP